MIIPDGNKPIKVGDKSFIYKGIYHPIEWLGKDPYRPRVEMLVIKDGKFLYARLKDDIEETPPDKRTHKYSIPGGSIDADSSQMEQAIAETNEEALVDVTLVYNSGIRYYDMYEPGFLLKGGDMPIEYVGSMSSVYVGVYDGPYDKSKVEEKDLDDDMANNGKFHEIRKIAKYLRKEHVDALLQCHFINEETKIALRLYRADAINESMGSSPILPPEDNRIYHGSTYEIETFQPMSLDLGNAFDEPGWSTFCFGDYNHAKLFGASKALTKLIKETSEPDDEPLSVSFVHGHLVMSEECFHQISQRDLLDIKARFYVYTIDSSNLELGFGNDPSLKEYTFRESNVPFLHRDTFDLSLMDLKELIEVTNGDFMANVNDNEYGEIGLLTHNYQTEIKVRERLQSAIDNGDLKPGDDIEEYMNAHNLDFESDDVRLPVLSMGTDEPVFESILSGEIQITLEKEYPEDCYGLPDRKAYPMPDKQHVSNAIRFFNYAKKDEEEELARNINRHIQKYRMTDIHVGKKNRFRKYYKPINESFTLNDFSNALQTCIDELNTLTENKDRYKLYGKMRGLVNMMVVQASAGIFTELDDAAVSEMLNASYASLAEIAENQMELMAAMEAKEIRTLALPVMEAPDDEIEGATDYTAMADDAGAEDAPGGDNAGDDDGTTGSDDSGDVFPENSSDDTGAEEDNTGDDGEEATDYTAMADDAGADETEDNDTGEGEDDSGGIDDSTGDDMSSDIEDSEGNDNRYDNKEIKNYFLLNSFLSLHQTVIDVLDTVNGVVLPTPDGNAIMAKVVKNLQDVKSFVEKFIQFHFNEKDYSFNLYYYNVLISVMRLNLKLFQTALSVTGDEKSKK